MKFSGKIKDGTSNEPLNFGSDPWPWRSFVLSECTLRAKVCVLRVLLVINIITKVIRVFSVIVYEMPRNFGEEFHSLACRKMISRKHTIA